MATQQDAAKGDRLRRREQKLREPEAAVPARRMREARAGDRRREQRADQRSCAERRAEDPEHLRAGAERFLRKHGSSTLKLKANVLTTSDEQQHEPDALLPAGVANRLHVPAKIAGGSPRSSGTRLAHAHREQAAEHGEEADGVRARSRAPGPKSATTTPPAAGPATRAPLKSDELSATAFGSSCRPDHLVRERLSGRRIEDEHAAAQRCQDVAPARSPMSPSKVITASTDASTIDAAWVAITSRRGSSRSVIDTARTARTR